jgi:hypothetical protein
VNCHKRRHYVYKPLSDTCRLEPKGMESGRLASKVAAHGHNALPAERQDPTLPVIHAEHGKPVASPVDGQADREEG